MIAHGQVRNWSSLRDFSQVFNRHRQTVRVLRCHWLNLHGMIVDDLDEIPCPPSVPVVGNQRAQGYKSPIGKLYMAGLSLPWHSLRPCLMAAIEPFDQPLGDDWLWRLLLRAPVVLLRMPVLRIDWSLEG